MATHSIDVPLPDSLQTFLSQPLCLELPPPGKAEINLPIGGTLKGITDVTKAIPDDCTLTFSLLLQLAPFLASIECLLRVLKLLKPLIEIINVLTNPPKLPDPKIVEEFVQAAGELIENCIKKLIPGIGILQFIKDIICLIIKLLRCLIGQLKSIAEVMGGIALEIELATAEDNAELLEQLECAQKNAATSAAYTVSAMEVVTMLLSLAEPLFSLSPKKIEIKIPTVGSPEDIETLKQTIATLEDVVGTLSAVIETLGLGSC